MSVTTPPDEGRRPLALGRDGAVFVDDEAVVWREHGIHRLNATATLVWDRCDGATDLDSIARALAARFRVGLDTVARDVALAIDELEARGLVTETVEPMAIPMIEPPIECTGCGDGPAFAARVLVAVDEGLLAVGADLEFAAELAAALGAAAMGVVDDGGRTSYGVVLPEAASGSRRDVARLNRGPDVLARSRQPEPVVEALIAQIGAHMVPTQGVVLDAVAVGRDGRVALVAPPANRVAFERRAEQLGMATAPGNVVVVEPSDRVAMIGAPWLTVDRPRLWRVLRGRAHVGSAAPALPAGEYEIVALGASVPAVAVAFGELAPAGSFAAADAPLRAVRDLGGTVPVVDGDDLDAISRLTRDPRLA